MSGDFFLDRNGMRAMLFPLTFIVLKSYKILSIGCFVIQNRDKGNLLINSNSFCG